MALLKKIIKNGPREVIIKWTGTGTDVLTLASLVQPGQTLTGVLVPSVNILSFSSSQTQAGITTITRNSEATFSVNGNYDFQPSIISLQIDENSGSDINVSMSTVGTLILKVKKMQGYTGI